MLIVVVVQTKSISDSADIQSCGPKICGKTGILKKLRQSMVVSRI